jgi:urea transport system permease protein
MPRSFCSILLALLVLIGESTRLLGLTAEDLKPLAEDDFDAKSLALNQIIAAGDATALRVLEAMGQENVVATSDGRVLIQDGDVLKDPITNAPVEVKASDVQPITLNNLLRARVESGLSGLRLQAPDHSVREKAINALFQAPDPAAKPLIEAARSKETDPVLKARLDQLWALTALQDLDASKRLESVQLINQRQDQKMRSCRMRLSG